MSSSPNTAPTSADSVFVAAALPNFVFSDSVTAADQTTGNPTASGLSEASVTLNSVSTPANPASVQSKTNNDQAPSSSSASAADRGKAPASIFGGVTYSSVPSPSSPTIAGPSSRAVLPSSAAMNMSENSTSVSSNSENDDSESISEPVADASNTIFTPIDHILTTTGSVRKNSLATSMYFLTWVFNRSPTLTLPSLSFATGMTTAWCASRGEYLLGTFIQRFLPSVMSPSRYPRQHPLRLASPVFCHLPSPPKSTFYFSSCLKAVMFRQVVIHQTIILI